MSSNETVKCQNTSIIREIENWISETQKKVEDILYTYVLPTKEKMPVDYIGYSYAATVAAGGIFGYAKAGMHKI